MKSVGFFLHHTSVNSVNSVGDTTHPDNLCKSVGVYLSRVKSVGFFCTIHLWNSVGDTTHPDNLCKSVKSVGEHLSRVKSVGALRIGILFAKTIFVVFDPPYFAKNQKQNLLSVFREFWACSECASINTWRTTPYNAKRQSVQFSLQQNQTFRETLPCKSIAITM